MGKNLVRINEEDFNTLVFECINRVLKENGMEEGFWNTLKGMGKASGERLGNAASRFGRNIQNTANNLGNNMRNAAQNASSRVKQGAQNLGNKVKQGVDNVRNTANDIYQQGVNYSNAQDIKKVQGTLQDMLEKGFLRQNVYNMVIGQLNKYLQSIGQA